MPYFTNEMKHSKYLPKKNEFSDKFNSEVNFVFKMKISQTKTILSLEAFLFLFATCIFVSDE